MPFSCKCPKCQAEVNVPDTAVAQSIHCPDCGYEVLVIKPLDRKNLGMATVSLVFGILSFIMVPFCGLVSLVTGIVSLAKIRASKGVFLGEGKAITGIILGAFSIVRFPILAILAAILLPALSAARDKAKEITCTSNLKQIGLAAVTFSQDNNGALPENYEHLKGYLETDLRCPCAKENEASYQLLPDICGKKLSEIVPSETPVAMCTRHRNRVVLYADGHVESRPISR